jgi:tetratricopeptide (TPR) repeat protein
MHDQAILDYTKAISLDPQNSFAYFNRGISYDKKANYNEALEDFTKVNNL